MQNSLELLGAWRSTIVDDAEPYLWTDEEAYRYADSAYRMFVRLIGGIHDFTSSVTLVPVVAGEALATVDRSILRFDSAHRVSDGRDISILNWTDRNTMRKDDYGFSKNLYTDATPGEVRYMVVGNQTGIVKWVQVPVVDDEVQLQVYRLPLARITDGTHTLDEVDEDHHIHLIEWMNHLAFLKRDSECYDKGMSDDAADRFRSYCAQCKAEADRYRSKVHVTHYGGI